MADVIVAALVAIALAGAVIKMIRDKKRTKDDSCAGDCSHCKGCR